jgi:hypothetical protein
LHEVFKMLLVGEVGVEVIFHVLDEIHVVLDEVISSNSCEGESIIIELPGVDVDSWFLTLSHKSVVDDECISISLSVEGS